MNTRLGTCRRDLSATICKAQGPNSAHARKGIKTSPSARPDGQLGSRTSDNKAKTPSKQLPGAQKPQNAQNSPSRAQTPQRLAKVIAQAGIASRRKAEELIAHGAVKVNKKTITVPQHMVVSGVDNISVDGKALPNEGPKYYFALNKPRGFLCSNSSSNSSGEKSQRLVVDLFDSWIENNWKSASRSAKAAPPRLFTVGRLDVQTTGLIFVTNDGDWAQRVQHPSNNLTKEYIVTLQKPPTNQQLKDIMAGCMVDGAFVQPKSLSYAALNRKDKLRIVIVDGRNREVRMLMENADLRVDALKRVRIGGFRLPNNLSIGHFQELKPYVVKRVTDKSIEMNPQTNPAMELART